MFEEHNVNQESSSQQHGFHLHFQIDRESYREVGCVGEELLGESAPLFRDLAYRYSTLDRPGREDLEWKVTGAAWARTHAAGSLDGEDAVAGRIADVVVRNPA